MGVTYTTASERESARRQRVLRRPHTLDLVLAGISILAALLLASAYGGRFAHGANPRAVNLNEVADARALEPLMAPLVETPGEARRAARDLFGFITQADGGRRTLPNVGAIARARVLSPAQVARLKPDVVVRDRASVRNALLLWGVLYLATFHAVSALWRWRGIAGDRVLLVATHALTALGFAAMVGRQDPLRDVLLFVPYAQGVIAGLVLAAAVSLANLRTTSLRYFSYLPLAGVFLLSLALILFGSGPTGSGAKVNLGPVQPIEGIRLLLAFFLAGYFARNWEMLRAVREEAIGGVQLPRWMNVPRLRYVAPVLIGVAAALALFFFQRDLGPALMLSLVFLAAYALARGRIGMALLGIAILCAGFFVGYRLGISATLAERVRMWQSPWDNTARGGDQVAHALWSMATGGPWGAGPGLGDSRYVPAGHTDLVLASIGEDVGMIGLLLVAALFAALIWRGLSTARRASTDYGFFLALVLTLFFAVPVILMAAGILGILPLTGVVTPFLSFGRSAMLANFVAVGLLAALRSDTAPAADLGVFARPVRWTGWVTAAAGVLLVVAAARVQVVQADGLAIRPHLGIQADGSRRYQYNPRVLDAARLIPRGSVLDRQGLALATDDQALLAKGRPVYEKLAVSLDAACVAGERCYPLGGRAFHLLGDATHRTNWSASNTSFVERDSEARLRGFDDHQTTVRVTDGAGGEAWTIRRDYRDLLPMLRHRRDPEHETVKAMLARPRDVTLTLDARLQVRVASILSRHVGRSKSGHAAAVAIDPATGGVLASVSYPYPMPGTARSGDEAERRDALLDRARYGLYPPGSTFKLVTAAAALLRDPAAARTAFTCSRLDDGRVGARVKGWARPIRDDVLDRNPHGTIDMHRAMVVSCNAYFAQLAASLGGGAMLEAAGRAEVALARGNAAARIRDTLPQIGYGQGEVVVSPLRMARIAAAIAAGGAIREPRIDNATPAGEAHEFVPAASARLLGAFMRDVVLDGTARTLRGEPIAIAGKTGTAEVADAPSHAWFVGFAPHGAARSRIAVAVVIENAGYGGTAAAPAAAEIIAAASSLGLIR